jgi:hypothetical protein
MSKYGAVKTRGYASKIPKEIIVPPAPNCPECIFFL